MLPGGARGEGLRGVGQREASSGLAGSWGCWWPVMWWLLILISSLLEGACCGSQGSKARKSLGSVLLELCSLLLRGTNPAPKPEQHNGCEAAAPTV